MATSQQAEQDRTLDVGGEVPVGAMVVHSGPVHDLVSPAEIASLIQQRDDQQIMSAIMGEVLDQWFYEFPIGGKTVEGVSVTGAMEFARIRGEQGFPIRFPAGSIRVEETIQNGEPGIRCVVVAREARTGSEGIGMAYYPYYTVRKGQREYDDKADRKALSVAKRNAVLDLVPEAQIISVLRTRKELAAVNEQRRQDETRATIAERMRNAPEAPRLTAGESLAPRDPYAPPANATAKVETKCPNCGGAMWDNRAKKASGEYGANRPDFSCKDRECKGAIWPPKDDKKPAARKTATVRSESPAPPHPADYQDDRHLVVDDGGR